MNLKPYLNGEKQGYSIEQELRIKKIIDRSLPYEFEIIKSNDLYAFDLELYEYKNHKMNNHERVLRCKIEIEVSRIKWISSWPKSWKNYSFLCRKVKGYYDKQNNWKNDFRTDLNKTFYLISNYEMTDCCCIYMQDLKNDWDNIYINCTPKEYYDLCGTDRQQEYLRYDLKQKSPVKRGFEQTMRMINLFLDDIFKGHEIIKKSKCYQPEFKFPFD